MTSVQVEQDGHVTTITLNNEPAKNACTGEMFVSLGAAFQHAGYSGSRAVILTGAGGNFCAGADLSGAGSGGSPGGNNLDGMRVLADVVTAIHGCPLPVVAKVDGVCVGAGLGLALAADMIWCSDRARFCAIFAKRGLSLDFGTSWFLAQRIGVHKAKEIALTAEMMNANRALEVGFVNAVVPADRLDTEVAALVTKIVDGPPIALSSIKRQLDNAASASLTQALEAEALAQTVNTKTEDMREAMTAWFEKRPPVFKGL